MSFLLDTCTLLWLADDTSRLSSSVFQALSNPENKLVVYQASFWEMQIKYDRGLLPLSHSPQDWLRQAVLLHDLSYAWIEDEDIATLSTLPDLHRDPFDRILICHALNRDHVIVTPDPHIHDYPGIEYLW